MTYEEISPPEDKLPCILNKVASFFCLNAKYESAEPLYRRALAINEKTFGKEHHYVATSLNILAMLYERQGRYAESEFLYKRALAIKEKAFGPEHPTVAVSLYTLAEIFYRRFLPRTTRKPRL